MELAVKSANASSGWSVDANVLEPDQRDFSGNIEGLPMTASSRINSRTDLNRIVETRCIFTVEEDDLLVNEKNIDRQTYTHHSNKCLDNCVFIVMKKVNCYFKLDRGVFQLRYSSQDIVTVALYKKNYQK